MRMNTRQMILVGFFAALTAVGAFIQVPLGTVPVTLQFLFTALSGIILGARLGALSQLIYLVIGLFGLPVFAGGTGGFGAVFKPSFGYLLGFVVGAYVIGKLSENNRMRSFIGFFAAAIAGVLVIYSIGVPYLYFIMKNVIGKDITFAAALKVGFIIFIPGDLLKCILAGWLGDRIKKHRLMN